MIVEGRTVAEIAAVGSDWPKRIVYLQPRNVLELGTGQGASGAHIMSALPPTSHFTSINYADGHHFGAQLEPWYADPRLTRLDVDSIDPATPALVAGLVDLLFIDTTHEAWHAAAELRLWQDKLEDGAVVIVDDLNQHDMMAFWESLPYEKVGSNTDSCQGVFRYDAARRYEGRFDRPAQTTYGTSLDPRLRK